MHFTVTVILPDEDQSEEIVDRTVSRILEPYCESIEVEESVIYPSDEEIRRNCVLFQIDRDDIPALVSFFDFGFGSGVSEEGIFYRSRENPQGKWDYWELIEEATVQDIISKGNLNKIAGYYLITPDGDWHEYGSGEIGSLMSSPSAKRKWIDFYQKTMLANSDKRIALVDCHV